MLASPLKRLKILAGVTDKTQDALLRVCLQAALELMCEYTGRRDWANIPPTLIGTQVNIALMLYNRRGIEGMTQADEGGVKRSVDTLPEDVKRVLQMHRVGHGLGWVAATPVKEVNHAASV